MNRDRVLEALQDVISQADYDLAKGLSADSNESGEDGWQNLVDIFIDSYEGDVRA